MYFIYHIVKIGLVSEQALNEATQSNSVQEMLANTSPVQQNVSQSSTR